MYKIVISLLIIGFIWYLLFGKIFYNRRPKSKYIDNFYSKFLQPVHQIDYQDQDSIIMYNVETDQCADICNNDETCKGFVYVPRESKCMFKTNLDNPVFARGHIAYLKE